MKLKELLKQNEENKLVLPDFQRDFEWKLDQQKNLLSSYFVSLPVGSILILEGHKEDFATKKMCFPKGSVLPKDECMYLLDGQQRISSLKNIFSNFFNDDSTWTDTWEDIYRDLRTRWFVRVKPKDDEEDIFGWRNLQFYDLYKYEPGQVINFFENKRIFKTKYDMWHNPGFSHKDADGVQLTGNRLNVEIAKYASDEYIVPLYSVYKCGDDNIKPLHEYVIERIANNRIEELKADVKDNRRDICGLLESVEPDINQLVKVNNQEIIRDAWARLGAKWSQKLIKFINERLDEEIPIIQLPSDEISRAISIFESINRGGTPLDTYDLIVAKAARETSQGSLSQRLLNKLQNKISLSNSLCEGIIGCKPTDFFCSSIGTVEDNKISNFIKNQFLNLLSIFSYFESNMISDLKVDYIKRNRILDLDYLKINSNTENTINSLIRACAFLQIRCGIISIKDLPYELMILPIAYMLSDDNIWNDKIKLAKIEYWYWCSLFGGAYRSDQNEQSIKDLKNLYEWLNGGENKFLTWEENVLNDVGYSDKNVLLMKDENHDIPYSIHKAILQYLISRQPKDFLNEQVPLNAWDIAKGITINYSESLYTLEVQDHHICPLNQAKKLGELAKELRAKKHILNSPLNRTYISSIANNIIREKTPDDYLDYVSKSTQWGHCIPTPFCEVYKRGVEETEGSYYERVLSRRYEELLKDLKTELTHLKQ